MPRNEKNTTNSDRTSRAMPAPARAGRKAGLTAAGRFRVGVAFSIKPAEWKILKISSGIFSVAPPAWAGRVAGAVAQAPVGRVTILKRRLSLILKRRHSAAKSDCH